MKNFEDLNIKKQLKKSLSELRITKQTPIQNNSYSPILSGNDFVGIAQTGTGKTLAYLLPILNDLSYSDQASPRILILAPTRELVIQIVNDILNISQYLTIRVLGVYGGSNNINSQKKLLRSGQDIVVATPQRLYDHIISNTLRLNKIKKLIIDEVDIMLDFGYKTQLKNIIEFMPNKYQKILFSATMTQYVDELIDNYLIKPIKKTTQISGTPIEKITQESYLLPNFYTKINLLNYLLRDKKRNNKVLIFARSKIVVEKIFDLLDCQNEALFIHSRKEQNYRTKSIENFKNNSYRILIATDLMARGIDIKNISTVINFDTSLYPENYIHRIGRTGRAENKGISILLYTKKEVELKKSIENLMKYTIPINNLPIDLEISKELTEEEKNKPKQPEYINKQTKKIRKKLNEGKKVKKEKVKKKSYIQQLKERYKKPIRRGDKIQNIKKKNKK